MSERHKKLQELTVLEDILPIEPTDEEALNGGGEKKNPRRHVTTSTTEVSSGLDSDDTLTSHHPPTTLVNPPASCSECFRDALLKALDHPIAQGLGILVLLAVIVVGAFFFFYLVGWQPSCRPRTDCQPRNDRYNVSVQILTALFTYMVSASLPWRLANLIHLTGLHGRGCQVGQDLNGLSCQEIWFHIPPARRLGIISWFLLNCLTQYANQVARILYSTYEKQATFPGNMWTNIFFVTSFLCAFLGSLWLLYEEGLLRQEHPGKFGPGPVELVQNVLQAMRRYVSPGKEPIGNTETLANDNDTLKQDQDPPDDTYPHSCLPVDRPTMRLFGM